jgi:hypothetical protein
MKKKLLIIVGAGASIDFGMPSVREIDKLFSDWANQWFPLQDNPKSNLYCYLRDVINRYYESGKNNKNETNFEEVLYQLNLLDHLSFDPCCEHALKALIEGKLFQFRESNNFNILSKELIVKLKNHFIDICKSIDFEKVRCLRIFLSAIKEKFEIGIITLNYDDVFTQTLPDLFTGFDENGKFNARLLLNRSDWNFIYHLHGSIHFSVTDNTISWFNKPEEDNELSLDIESEYNKMIYREGLSFYLHPIIAGYGKTLQVLRQPFRTYFAHANYLVNEADNFLFLGYGFGDEHLNALFSDIRDDRKRKIVIISKESEKQQSLPCRKDLWSYNLHRAIGFCFTPQYSCPENIKEFLDNNELEVSDSPDFPLAVWYNGMLEACKHPDKILAHLC